ncbi:MAG: CTP synthetase [Halarchaeum sp.]
MNVVIVGPDRGLGDALSERGATVTRIEGVASGERLREAGIETADLLVVTDVGEATAVPVALEANPDLRTVVYAPDSAPEFVRGNLDLAVHPDVLSLDAVADELANANA